MRKILFFLFLTLQISAQEYSVKKGVVVDSLKVSDTLDETFAIYLPTNFNNQKTWPVLFILDEKGRGKAAAQLFKPAAERQGYVLISSNNIYKDKELVKNVEGATRLLRSTYSSIPIDINQISTAGSGEGARVASSLPFVFKDIFGVVAVGNHWVNFDFLDEDQEFVFIGVVGDEQFTSAGMKMTSNSLKLLKFPSEIYTYSGDKDWPEPELVSSAVGSLTLEAIRENLRASDKDLVNTLYQEDLNRVNKMMSTGNLLLADSFLELMKSKYQGLRDLSEVSERQQQLRRSRNFESQRKEQEKVAQKESRLLDDFIYYLQQDVRNRNFENLGWWNYQKNQLDSLAKKGGAEGKMAERLKGYISEMARMQKKELKKKKAPLEPLLLVNMLQTIFDPTNFEAYKEIISLSAQDNDFSTSLFYLEEMLKHGFKDKAELYNIEGTLGLRLTPEYNWLIEKYLGSARFHETEDKP